MTITDPETLLSELLRLPHETEWVEFKASNDDPEEIGTQISALANSAALSQRERGFVVWGVEDLTHDRIGTTFHPGSKRVGNEELENWLATQLRPQVHFQFKEFVVAGKRHVILEVEPASSAPVAFKGREWIRVGSYTKPLQKHPEKEKLLWRLFSGGTFETRIALSPVSSTQALELLRYLDYFDLLKQPVPSQEEILAHLRSDGLISAIGNERYAITNLGAVLFANDLNRFEGLRRKAIRVISYRGASRIDPEREQVGTHGYASGFRNLIRFISSKVPRSEQIKEALRIDVTTYPEIAIREIVANALIHQDFEVEGAGPMVEIFPDRIEVTNPGTPLIDVQRLLDLPPRSRNDKLAGLMRRLGICEERGSGIDKVFSHVELYQLPPPDFQLAGDNLRVFLFGPRSFRRMTPGERTRACYQHAALKWVSNEQMTNATLRKRFSVPDRGYTAISRIIADAVRAKLVKRYGPTAGSKRHAAYVPFWA